MAKPIQYVQQYVPTDMNLAQNVLGMARQDMKERNQAFDAAAAFENSAIGQAYGIETWDTEHRNKIVEGIQSKIDEAVKKRGGDYAVAGNDIAKVIMKERSNPFWNDNAQQMEAIKQYRELSRDADNEIVGDPRMSYEDIQRLKAEGKDPFSLTAVKKSEVRRISSDIFSNFAKTMRNGDGTWKPILYSEDPYTNQKMNQYYQNIVQYGFKDEKAADEFLAKPEGQKLVNSILSSYPQLEGASKERVTEIIKQGALSGIGKAEDKTVANQGFATRPMTDRTDVFGGRTPFRKIGYGLQPENLDVAKLTNKTKLEKEALQQAKEKGLKVNSYQELEDLASKMSFPKIGKEFPSEDSENQYIPLNKTNDGDKGSSSVAEKILSDLDSKVKTDPSYAKPSFNIDRLTYANPKGIDFVNDLSDQLNKVVSKPEVQNKFEPATKSDKKEFEKVKDASSIRIVGITPNLEKGAVTPLIVDFVGEDKNGKPVYFKKYMKKDLRMLNSVDPLEDSMFGYLEEVDASGGFRNYREFMSNTKEYLDYTRDNLSPKMYSDIVNENLDLIEEQLSEEDFKKFREDNKGIIKK